MLTLVEKKLALMILGFLGAAVAIAIFILIPTFKQIKDLDDQKARLLEAVEKKSQESISFHVTNKQLENYKKTAPDFDSYLFRSGQELKLISLFEGIAASQGVTQKIGASNLDDPQKEFLKLSITVTGRYRSLISYLKEVEQLPYFVIVNMFSFSPLQDSGQATMNLDLVLYVNK